MVNIPKQGFNWVEEAWLRAFWENLVQTLQVWFMWIWNYIVHPVYDFMIFLTGKIGEALGIQQWPDITPLLDHLAGANLWLPVSEGFIMLTTYFTLAGTVIFVRWVIKFIPTIG